MNNYKWIKITAIMTIILCIYPVPAYAETRKLNLTLGIGTPLATQDAYSSTGKRWEIGDVIGSAIASTSCPLLSKLDCSIWHHSLISDTNDYGVTGMSISYTWKITF